MISSLVLTGCLLRKAHCPTGGKLSPPPPLRLGDFIDKVPMLTKEGKCEWGLGNQKERCFYELDRLLASDFEKLLAWLKSPMEEMCHIGCKECDSPNDSWQNASRGFAFAWERQPWPQRDEGFIIFVGDMRQSKVQSPFIARGIGKKPCRGWQFWLTELSGLSK